jgi:ribonuclease T
MEFDEDSAHSAAYDAEITADVFCEIVNRFQPVFEGHL